MIAISLIVPVYNVASYIGACMQSICAQTFSEPFEVIVVDDCGHDDSISIAEQALKHLPPHAEYRILHHERNRGLSAARNTGHDVARGKYLLFVDSDDQITPDCLEKLYRRAEATAADLTYGAYETFADSTEKKATASAVSADEKAREGAVEPPVRHTAFYVMAWNKLLRKDFLDRHGIRFIEGLVHEDNPWTFEISVHNPKIASVSDLTYRYLVRENSLQTARDFAKHFDAYCQVLQAYAASIAHTPDPSLHIPFLERQKALYFAMTLAQGTRPQQHRLYRLIRTLRPLPACTKADFHYRLPAGLGFYAYRKFHRYHLC